MKNIKTLRYLIVSVILIVAPFCAAYVGPGAGLSAIGSALALIGAVLLGIIGFFWYPVKRLIRKFKN